jgi:hypothetical protein
MINEKRLPIIDNAEEERCWHLVSQIESVVNQLEIDFAKIRDDQTKIRDDQTKIRDDQAKIRDDLHMELMYSEEDVRFYRNLNSKIPTNKDDQRKKATHY